jgi:hypothetical protein
LSCRRLGSGSNGSITSHCSSVISFCRFFMTEAQQLTPLTRSVMGKRKSHSDNHQRENRACNPVRYPRRVRYGRKPGLVKRDGSMR